MNKQKQLSHLESLELKHKELDKQIEMGYTNYLDDGSLAKMKQEKLYLKDQIEQIRKKVA